MSRVLRKRTLAFSRAAEGAFVDDAGNFIVADGPPTTFNVRGSLQPLSQKEKETIPTKDGVYEATAFYFYTKTSDIRPIKKGTPEADTALIGGETFVVWANSPWEGVTTKTTHNVITLVKLDEVVLNA